ARSRGRTRRRRCRGTHGSTGTGRGGRSTCPRKGGRAAPPRTGLDVPSRSRLLQQDEVLRRVTPCSLGLQLKKRESLGEGVAEVLLRVVGAAEIRPDDLAPADDEVAPLEAPPLVLVQARHV